MALRVVRLQAENFKRLRAIELEPDRNIVVLAGRNAQGKSSIMQAIWSALAGAAAMKGTTRPVRDGEDDARVEVDLGDIKVTRVWTAEGKTAVTLRNAEGAKFSSPQGMLNELIGSLSFDPLAFATSSPREQLATLVELVKLPFDPEERDRQRQAWFDQRTDVNRDAKAIAAQIAGIPKPPDDLPIEEVSAAALFDEMSAAQAEIEDHASTRRQSDEAVRDYHAAEENVAALEAQLAKAQQALQIATSSRDGFALAVEQLPPDPDLGPFQKRIAALDDTNAAIRSAKKRAELGEEHERLASHADDLTLQIEELDAERRRAMSDAEMPIEGLDIGAGHVIYQGVPFEQASTAEQMRVSVSIAMAANPELRVIRIENGSLLDAENLAMIEAMAVDRDYQIWVETLESSSPLAIQIEDGSIVDVAAVEA